MSSFHDRQKNLFNHLKDAEEQYSFAKSNKATDTQDYSVIDKHTYRRIKKEMKQFRGKESIFKRNEANIRECLRARCVPDHTRNPQKWVHYSLEDVTPDQMSDATNTATALALMRKLEEREAAVTKMEQDSEDALIFKKPTFQVSSVIKKPPPEIEKITFKSSKVIMPEYVVGLSKKKEKKNPVQRCDLEECKTDPTLNLKLNHLYDDDDDEEN